MPKKLFQKGNKPLGGRKKGTPNKSTKAFREVMQALLDKNEENFSTWIKDIARRNPRAAMDLLLRAAEFAAPKLNRTELVGDPNGNPVLVTQLVDNIPAAPADGTDSAATLPGAPGDKN